MGYYNWEKIVKSYSENELKRIFSDKNKEPSVKVQAVIREMRIRGLLSPDYKTITKRSDESYIKDISQISNTKPNLRRAKNIIIVIQIILFFNVVTIISYIMQYSLLISAKNGLIITEKIANMNNIRVQILAYINSVILIASIIFFLFWFNRAYENLQKRFLKCNYDSGWAIGSWFVPILSLFRPYYIMKELIIRTKLILTHRKIDFKNDRLSFVGLWWTFWIISNIIYNKNLNMVKLDTTLDTLIFSTILHLIINILNVTLSVFTILMINRFSENEELLFKSEINNNLEHSP